MVNGNTFASVTFVPACEGGQAGAGGAVGVRGALGAVRCAPEVVRATKKKLFMAKSIDENGANQTRAMLYAELYVDSHS